jgi:hypothetical protein
MRHNAAESFARRSFLSSRGLVPGHLNERQAMKERQTHVFVVEVRTRLFPWEPIAVHSFEVHPDGKITVWDDKAKRYTNNHALTAGARNRIKRLAGIR